MSRPSSETEIPSSPSATPDALPSEMWGGLARGDIALRDVLRVDAALLAKLAAESEALAAQNLPIDAAIIREGLAALEPDRPEHWVRAAELYEKAGSFEKAEFAREQAREAKKLMGELDWTKP